MSHCAGVATDLVRRGHLGDPSWELRGRTAAPRAGAVTPLGNAHSLTFNRTFWNQLDAWARNMNHWTAVHAGRRITAFGEVGSMACHRPTAAHNRARGLDLCQIRFTDGSWIDMNASHAMNGTHQRRYLAVAANLRRYFGTVLTRHYNSAHRDHIHVDDLTAVAPLRTDKRTDTTLVQSAANLLAGAGLAVDGVWGSRTEAAYRRLLDAFGMACTDPKRSVHHAQVFLSVVTSTAMADRAAGFHVVDACADRCDDDLLTGLECAVEDLLGG